MKPLKSWLKSLPLVVIIITFWVLFTPMQLGGQSAYLIINGNSMEPVYHQGDLVIVRKSALFEVGDIVGYRNADLKNFVLHRIVGQELDRFILKGDNNSWEDSFQPTSSDILGLLWVHLPRIGKAIGWIRQPMIIALISGLAGGILMIGMVMDQSKQKKNMKKEPLFFIETIPLVLWMLGIFTLTAFILMMIAFSQPLQKTIAYDRQFQQNGTFFYSAAAPPGIYDSTTLHEGQPIYPGLSCKLNLGFGYTAESDNLQKINGSYQLAAQIFQEQSGWQRTFALQSGSAFIESMFVASAELNLCQVEAIVAAVEEQTGINPGVYSLAIFPNVTVTGKVEGQQFSDTFNPRLVFRFDKSQFYLFREDPEVDPLNPTKNSPFKTNVNEENAFSLLGIRLTILKLRILSLLFFISGLIGLFIFGRYAYRTGRKSQDSLIRMKYGSVIVDVQHGETDAFTRMINIASMDDLAKLAERNNTMILHEKRGSANYYFVNMDGITYAYIFSNGNREDININE